MSATALAAAVAVWAALAVHTTVTDLRRRIISKRACWCAAVTIAALHTIAALAANQPRHLLTVAAGTAAVVALTELLWQMRPAAVGYGDIRLINVNSLLLAWWGPAWPWLALSAASLAAAPQAITASRRHGRSGAIPFAPALAVGTAAALTARLAIAP